MRSCFNHLEHSGKLERKYYGGQFIKRERGLLSYRIPIQEDRGGS